MRRGRKTGNPLGGLMIAAGVLILMSLVLPEGFWWFLLGMGLICCGFWCCRH